VIAEIAALPKWQCLSSFSLPAHMNQENQQSYLPDGAQAGYWCYGV